MPPSAIAKAAIDSRGLRVNKIVTTLEGEE